MKNDEECKAYIDNLNHDLGDGIGGRRLRMLAQGINLYPLKLAIYSLGELLKVATPTQWFIDSEGQVFQYKKTHFVPVVYKEIKEYYKHSAFETVITTYDSPPVYKTLYPPTEGEQYAVFLQLSAKSLLFYGYSTTKYENKRKKI
jgi:hypothetical protein